MNRRESKVIPCNLVDKNGNLLPQGPWINVESFTPKDVRGIHRMAKKLPDKN